MKIEDYDPQTPPSQWLFHSCNWMPLTNGMTEKCRATAHLSALFKRYISHLKKSSLFFLNFCLISEFLPQQELSLWEQKHNTQNMTHTRLPDKAPWCLSVLIPSLSCSCILLPHMDLLAVLWKHLALPHLRVLALTRTFFPMLGGLLPSLSSSL